MRCVCVCLLVIYLVDLCVCCLFVYFCKLFCFLLMRMMKVILYFIFNIQLLWNDLYMIINVCIFLYKYLFGNGRCLIFEENVV